MTTEPTSIRYEDFLSRPDDVFDQIDRGNGPVYVERSGRRYRLESQAKPGDEVWAKYDPAKALQALRSAARAIEGIDREDLLAGLRAGRSQNSSGRPAD